MNETIYYGTCACGTAGQLFKTGKCAHCYIAELEHRLSVSTVLAPTPSVPPHHASCKASDQSLVWECSQCGVTEHAAFSPSSAVACSEGETPHTEALRYLCRTCIPSASQAMETALDQCAEMEREVNIRRKEAVAMTGLLAKARAERDALRSAPSSATHRLTRRCFNCGGCETPGMPASCDCDKPQFISSSIERVTDDMVEAGARRMAGLVRAGIIEKPPLTEWEPWAGSVRAVLEAALARAPQSATTATRDAVIDQCAEEAFPARMTVQNAYDRARMDAKKDILLLKQASADSDGVQK